VSTHESSSESAGRLGAFPAGLAYIALAAYRASGTEATLPRAERSAVAAEAMRALSETRGVALRGTYHTSGFRSDCDLLVWLAAPGPELLQETLGTFRHTRLGATMWTFWTSIGVHRDGEFPKTGPSAYFRGEGPRRYVSVASSSQSTDWYGLEGTERRRLLAEYARSVRDFPDVRVNAVNTFGLADDEWLMAFEGEQLVRIVDMLRHVRSTQLRAYTASESSVITGVRRPLAEIVDALP
jgi:hydrogen peroxide-dependent heme synthase